MVIKGSTRGHSRHDVRRLARHLLDRHGNELVKVLEVRGCVATGLEGALDEMEAIASASRCRRPLYSASINVAPNEQGKMNLRRWLEAVDELEQRLGMAGHQRVVIGHRKAGREHIHVVFNRVDPRTLKAARDSWSYRIHEESARALEQRWGMQPVIGAHVRDRGAPRPMARTTHRDAQAGQRTGVPPDVVSALLQAAWTSTGGGIAFAVEVERQGLRLVRGRRGIVAIDGAGTPHSLPRRLRLPAAEVRKGLAGIDATLLPEVDEAKREKKEMRLNRRLGAEASAETEGVQPTDWWAWAEFWRNKGMAVDERDDGLWVQAPDGAWIHDQGDRITILRDGEPTDDDICSIVAAGRARGWENIRFFGGSEEWQRRAREEAIRQGFPPEAISLECEDHIWKVAPAAPAVQRRDTEPLLGNDMPSHIARRLGRDLPAQPPSDTSPEFQRRPGL